MMLYIHEARMEILHEPVGLDCWMAKVGKMMANRFRWHNVLAVVLSMGLPVLGQSNAVSTSKFQLTFPTTWGYLLGQGATTASETDSTAIRGNAGGLNGQALMGLYASSAPLDVGNLPNQVLVGGATGRFTKTKDSSATFGSYVFQIADFTYDSLAFPVGVLPAGISAKSSGKMRLYATQAGSQYFVLALTSLLAGPTAILSYADVEKALKTLVLNPNGAGILSQKRLVHRGPKHPKAMYYNAMGRQTKRANVTKLFDLN
jgi:hypothetical protein